MYAKIISKINVFTRERESKRLRGFVKLFFSFFFFVILFFTVHSSVYAATYYSAKVSGQWKYRLSDWPTATTGSNCVINYIGGCVNSVGANTIVLDGGLSGTTYTGADFGSSGTGGLAITIAGQTIRGPVSTDPDQANHGGIVTLSGTGLLNATLACTQKNNCSISYLTFTNSAPNLGALSFLGTGVGSELLDPLVDHVTINGGDAGIYFGNYVGTSTHPAIVSNTTIKNTTNTTSMGDNGGTNNVVIWNYDRIENNAAQIRHLKTSTTTFNNVTWVGNAKSIISADNTGVQSITLNNCLIIANGYSTLSTKTISRSNTNATVTVNNSILLPNPLYNTTWDTITENNNQSYPVFQAHRRSNAVVSIELDDLVSLSDFANKLAPLLEARGMRGTIAVNVGNATTSDYQTMAQLINAGHDVALHTDSHATLTDTNGPTIQYVGSKTYARISVSNASNKMYMETSDDNITWTKDTNVGVNGDIALDSPTYLRVSYICAALDALADYTCSPDALTNPTRSTSLADVTNQNIKTVYTLPLDGASATGRYYINEITNAKATLEAGIRAAGVTEWTARSFVYPQDGLNATIKQAVINAGLIGTRSSYADGVTNIYNLDVFNIRGFQLSARFKTDISVSDATLKRNVSSLIEYLKYSGGIGIIFDHTMPDDGITNVATWTAVLDTIQASGITVKTVGQAIADIRAGANHNTGTTYYACVDESESCLSDVSNYQLKPISPAINAGINVGLTTDLLGNPIVGVPDIGSYEFQAPAAPTSLTQYKSDGTTSISTGNMSDTATVVLKFTMASSNSSDLLTPQIEVQPIGTNFTNTFTNSGTAVAYSGSGVTGTITVTGLAGGNYHWQARVNNSAGNGSWASYGGNAESATDFSIDSTSPAGGSITYSDGKQDSTTVNLTVNDGTDSESGVNTATRTVLRKSATLSGDFCGNYSSFATTTVSGTYPNFVDSGVARGNCYQYEYQVSDNAGNTATYISTSTAKILFSTPSTPACNDTTPTGTAPWLYEANSNNGNSITLRFTNWQTPTDHFALEYGTESNKYSFGVTSFGNKDANSYTVNSLNSNTTYYFRVRTGNGCATGSWSNELSVKTLGFVSLNNLNVTNTSIEPTTTESNTGITGNTGDKNTETQTTGYLVNIKVKDTKGKAIENATVTLHSTPQTTKTNSDGVATFNNVEAGNHTVDIAYNNYQGEQSINLTGDVKEFNINVTVQQKPVLLSPLAYGVIGVLVLVIAILIFRQAKKNKIKKL